MQPESMQPEARAEAGTSIQPEAPGSRLGADGRTAFRAAVPTISAVVVVNLLVAEGVTGAVRAIFVLPVLLLLPGRLTLRAMGWYRPPGWDRLLYSLALSLLWLLATSFLLALSPTGGGLSEAGCLIGFDLVIVGLLTAGYRQASNMAGGSSRIPPLVSRTPPLAAFIEIVAAALGRDIAVVFRHVVVSLRALPRRMLTALGCSSLAVGLAAAGALRLTAGGGPALTELALATGIVALVLAVSGLVSPAASVVGRHSAGRSVGDHPDRDGRVIPGMTPGRGVEQAAATTIYLVGLAVLLATSLRGDGVTGHDVKIEFAVFDDTLSRGSWRPGGQYPAYNSCLSITVLPTFLLRLLDIPPPDIYRVCYQIIFAAVPVGVFLIARRLLPPSRALLSGALFIAFPTFINDMPMLNRQEIAFVFFVVGVLTLVDVRGRPHRSTTLFIALALGLTVSHYSTTYVAAVMLLIGRVLLSARSMLRGSRARPARGAIPEVFTLPAVIVLIVLAAGWGAFTGNVTGLVTTGRATFAAINSNISASSDAVNYSFFEKAPPLTDQQALDAYLADIRKHREPVPTLAPAPHPQVLAPDVLPLTWAGRAMSSLGVPVGMVNSWARRAAVLLFEVGATAGVGLLWWRSRRSADARVDAGLDAGIDVDAVLAVLGVACLVLLAAVVVLPELSVSYGLLRLYQQALIILAPAVAVCLATVAHLAGRIAGGRDTHYARPLSTALVAGCLVTTSGLLPQLTGDYPPQLNLNNAGTYYRAYYTSAADLAVVRWAGQHVPAAAAVTVDAADAATLRSTTRLYVMEGIDPGFVPPYAYLQVRMRGTEQVQAVAIFRDRILTYTFPLSSVNQGRRLLYSDGHHRVYGPAP
jgi:hypothetical protein